MPRSGDTSVYQALRADILGGSLTPGSTLREVAVAERFGVSRTPVREALRRLEHEGLLQRSTAGLTVRVLRPEEIVQVYDLRILLEGEAAEQAAQFRTDADLARLEGMLRRDLSRADPDDATRITTNLEFHAAVWACSHNAVLVDVLDRLSTHLVHAPHSTLSMPGRWEAALHEHAALLDAVRARDADIAGRVAREHMTTARGLRLELLRDAAAGRPG